MTLYARLAENQFVCIIAPMDFDSRKTAQVLTRIAGIAAVVLILMIVLYWSRPWVSEITYTFSDFGDFSHEVDRRKDVLPVNARAFGSPFAEAIVEVEPSDQVYSVSKIQVDSFGKDSFIVNEGKSINLEKVVPHGGRYHFRPVTDVEMRDLLDNAKVTVTLKREPISIKEILDRQ